MEQALADAPALVAVTSGPRHHVAYTNAAYRRVFGPDDQHDAPAGRLDAAVADPLEEVFTSGRPCSRGSTSDRGDQYTFGYSALHDSSGQVIGIMVVGVPGVASGIHPDPPHQPDELQVTVRGRQAAQNGENCQWYDVIALGAGRTALAIGEVHGRGPHAEELTRQLRSALRAYARLDLPPAEMLGLLEELVSELQPVQTATCLYATFDPVESLLCFAAAGHPAPLLRQADGTVHQLEAQQGAPLGLESGAYPVQQLTMPAGATLLLFTDGLDAALAAGLAEVGGRPLDECADAVLDEVAGDDPDADVTLLLARSAPPASAGAVQRSMRLQLNTGVEPARRARAYANGVLSAWQLPQGLREDITVVVGELVANAVLHSGRAQEMRLRRTTRRVVLEVLDRSPRAPKPRPADPEAESGRGMHMVAQLADRWGVRPLDGGKSVWCEFLA